MVPLQHNFHTGYVPSCDQEIVLALELLIRRKYASNTITNFELLAFSVETNE